MNPHDDDPPQDDALRRALRDAPATDPAALEALQSRVMAQWREGHGRGGAQANGARTLRWSTQRWWIGAAGLATCAAVAVGLWMSRPDPALEELMQPDVLSQMVAGEL